MKIQTILFALLSVFAFQPLAYPQGHLAPSGPPGETMKTLDQIDAKLDVTNSKVDAATGKLDTNGTKLEKRTPISSLPFNIGGSGSYYLTQSLGVSSGSAISINADNVSLDLNGFTLSGSGGSQNGIIVLGAHRHIRVYNGSVRGFGVNGVDLGNVVLAEIHSLVVSGNGGVGIYAGDNVTVRDCASRENGGDNFRTAAHAVISHCSAVLSTNGHGFSVTEDCELSHCVSDSNRRGYSATDGFSITSCVARRNKDYGIYAENSAVIINCTASGQFIQNQSGATGIRVGNDGMVSGCTSSRNAGDGIQVISYSQVIHNTVSENGFLTGAQANGIHILGVNNRVDSNHVTRHLGVGILTDQQSNAQNFIVRNTFANNATAILSSGSDQYIGITTQNPFDPNPSAWANFR